MHACILHVLSVRLTRVLTLKILRFQKKMFEQFVQPFFNRRLIRSSEIGNETFLCWIEKL